MINLHPDSKQTKQTLPRREKEMELERSAKLSLFGEQRHFACFPLILGVLFVCTDLAAQEMPPKEILNAIIPQLSKRKPGAQIFFGAPALERKLDVSCGMQQANMTVVRDLDQ